MDATLTYRQSLGTQYPDGRQFQLYFQVCDEEGRELQRMMSATQLHGPARLQLCRLP